jgi:hypothetical protein
MGMAEQYPAGTAYDESGHAVVGHCLDLRIRGITSMRMTKEACHTLRFRATGTFSVRTISSDAPHSREAVLSIITGGGKWMEITIPMDPLYLTVLVSAEKTFWRCVQSGEAPHLINAEPPRPRIEAIRVVDMTSSNSWAEFAALFRSTCNAFLDHERAKSELKALIPEDAKEAIGHGVRARRPKTGAMSLEVLEPEASALAKAQAELVQKSRSQPRSDLYDREKRSAPFAMRCCRAASISCPKPWVGRKSQPYRARP